MCCHTIGYASNMPVSSSSKQSIFGYLLQLDFIRSKWQKRERRPIDVSFFLFRELSSSKRTLTSPFPPLERKIGTFIYFVTYTEAATTQGGDG